MPGGHAWPQNLGWPQKPPTHLGAQARASVGLEGELWESIADLDRTDLNNPVGPPPDHGHLHTGSCESHGVDCKRVCAMSALIVPGLVGEGWVVGGLCTGRLANMQLGGPSRCCPVELPSAHDAHLLPKSVRPKLHVMLDRRSLCEASSWLLPF